MTKPAEHWESLTPDERQDARLRLWLEPPDLAFADAERRGRLPRAHRDHHGRARPAAAGARPDLSAVRHLPARLRRSDRARGDVRLRPVRRGVVPLPRGLRARRRRGPSPVGPRVRSHRLRPVPLAGSRHRRRRRLPVRRGGVHAAPASTTGSPATPPGSCCAATCPASPPRWPRSPAWPRCSTSWRGPGSRSA